MGQQLKQSFKDSPHFVGPVREVIIITTRVPAAANIGSDVRHSF